MTLIVVNMNGDFVYGPLGSKEAQAIVPKVKKKIEERLKKLIFSALLGYLISITLYPSSVMRFVKISSPTGFVIVITAVPLV